MKTTLFFASLYFCIIPVGVQVEAWPRRVVGAHDAREFAESSQCVVNCVVGHRFLLGVLQNDVLVAHCDGVAVYGEWRFAYICHKEWYGYGVLRLKLLVIQCLITVPYDSASHPSPSSARGSGGTKKLAFPKREVLGVCVGCRVGWGTRRFSQKVFHESPKVLQ